MIETYTLDRGTVPLLVSMPHDGIEIPDDIAARMTMAALRRADTDWHVSRLYAFAREMGASMLRPRYSRLVVDLNRPSDGAALYPGKNETGLVPTVTFGNEPVYASGHEPTDRERRDRVDRYWRPYHTALEAEINRLVTEHGRCVLWEAHTIKGRVPFFFDGELPDLNLGTADGASCKPALEQQLMSVLASVRAYTSVVNGRFKGGYITRNYADASRHVDAVQLELAQRTYMDEESFAYDERKASLLEPVLRGLLEAALSV